MKKNKQEFYDVMDEIQKYDQLLTELNEVQSEAMIDMVYLKFKDQSTSVNYKGFKPTPAMFGINDNYEIIQRSVQSQPQQLSTNQTPITKTINFTYRIDSDQEQYTDQVQIEKQLSLKLSENKQSKNIIIQRFNIMNNIKSVESIANKFQKYLIKCLELAKQKQRIMKKIKDIQKIQQINGQDYPQIIDNS